MTAYLNNNDMIVESARLSRVLFVTEGVSLGGNRWCTNYLERYSAQVCTCLSMCSGLFMMKVSFGLPIVCSVTPLMYVLILAANGADVVCLPYTMVAPLKAVSPSDEFH
jgi:hypothetical protein